MIISTFSSTNSEKIPSNPNKKSRVGTCRLADGLTGKVYSMPLPIDSEMFCFDSVDIKNTFNESIKKPALDNDMYTIQDHMESAQNEAKETIKNVRSSLRTREKEV